MNLEKTIIEGDLWYIENFLTKEEIDWMYSIASDPDGWYITMRSPYKNIGNKWLNVDPSSIEYDENGNFIFPDKPEQWIPMPLMTESGGIWERLEKVLPKTYNRSSVLQSFLYKTDEEILECLKSDQNLLNQFKSDKDGFAMNWHFEGRSEEESAGFGEMVSSFSLYVNDDYEGGELIFQNKPYRIKPKAGMLVHVPLGKEWTHKVTKVIGKDRHTFYGSSWKNLDTRPYSTTSDC